GGPVRTFGQAKAADHERFARFFHHLLGRGVYLPPSGFEMWTLSTTHGPQEIERTLEAASSFRG
ncbi:MAG: aspartate aminotransferase family protein, partial [Actinomycetota bacterium]